MTTRCLADVGTQTAPQTIPQNRMSPQRHSYMPLGSFHATRNGGTKVDHGSVEFAVHPPHENELRTQVLDGGGGERTLIGIQVDLHFLRSAKVLQVGSAEFGSAVDQKCWLGAAHRRSENGNQSI